MAVVGNGRLAGELLQKLELTDGAVVRPRCDVNTADDVSMVVHTGSGRELAQVVSYFERTQATLLEPSKGSALEK